MIDDLGAVMAEDLGMRSASGAVLTEFPDRISDVVVLAGAGYATARLWLLDSFDAGVAIGWAAVVLSLLTAYVRVLGTAAGEGTFFTGPMSKPRRIWILVAAALLSCLEPAVGAPRGIVLAIALSLICAGALVTIVIRLRWVTRSLAHDEPGRHQVGA